MLASLGSLAVLLEAISFVGLWVHDGAPFSWSRMQTAREEVVRRFDPATDETRDPDVEVIHPYLGFVMNPDRWSGISQFGYSGSNPMPARRSEDRVVIALVGGSVAHNFAEAGAPELARRLAASPAFSGKEIVTVDLAMGGYKQPQQLMTLNYLLALGFEFDVVVNIDGFNEVALHGAENARKDVFPIYPRAWYSRVGGMPDRRARLLLGRIADREERMASAARTFSIAPLRLSVTGNLIWRLIHESLVRGHWAASDDFRRYEPAETPYLLTGPRVGFPEEAQVYDHLVGIWKRCSLQMHRLCRANGIRYYHFLQPNQYAPGSKRLTPEERASAWREDHPYRPGAEKGYPRLRRAGRDLEDLGVRFVDLTGLFAGETRTIYADDCCHYNDLGNLTLAGHVADAIVADFEGRPPLTARRAGGEPRRGT